MQTYALVVAMLMVGAGPVLLKDSMMVVEALRSD